MLAENTDAQTIQFSDTDLRSNQHTARAVFEAQQDAAVIVDSPPRNDGIEIGQELCDTQTGDELGQMKCMHADVGDAAAGTGPRGIESPVRLLARKVSCQPAL